MEFDETTVQSIAKQPADRKAKVAYFYDPDIGSYYYGPGHPMKPQRMRMTHSLILAYDLYKYMEVYRPHDAEHTELVAFHDSDYVNFLSEITLDNYKHHVQQMRRFNLGEATDCPIFDGVFEFQASCAGASIDAACQLNHGNCDIALNWSGGLHHAKRAEASGFCYINDIVLGIIELLKYHTRVMYIDIDIHHGDGVEEAFYLTHRVMTVSFHKFGDFFPGTGDVVDVGAGPGKYYAVNVPLNDGVTDEQFVSLFKAVMPKCIESFQPEAIVLQCGADSITGDRLGNFNVSTKGHAACVEFIKSFKKPLMILGGGGYTIKNVARAWFYETAVALDRQSDIDNKIPVNEYYEYFAPEFNLHLRPDPNAPNKNTDQYIEAIKTKIFSHISHLEHAPSVQFTNIPADFFNRDSLADDQDEIDQFTVEWEGGGLGVDLSDSRKYLMPTKLRRANYDVDDSEDRDQKQQRTRISIMAGLKNDV
eukprot:Blabericola_migrator_1__7745@NODE_395_length_8977_cov_183_416835_g72_i1_p3_GENE_NODE_395_length_8977_cov_183_416835_g72_i1NODE_395_length_8977_cov_183_416835_g72_i1_p3_ORF_typecomplete_len478_score85_94Hist_deacetyl/PF00850_19/1_2e89_NODE_395_length_8977_cov_183_416835_g72_i171268559